MRRQINGVMFTFDKAVDLSTATSSPTPSSMPSPSPSSSGYRSLLGSIFRRPGGANNRKTNNKKNRKNRI